jgi:hypothetical protein
MSKEVLEQVVLKASSDARFRAQMNDNFEAALRPYDLSPAEKAKLRSGIGGLSDDREARRMMAATAVSTVAASANAATAESGTAESGTAESGTAESGTAESGTAESGTAESGTAESGTAESGTAESGSVEAGSHLTS